MDRSSILFLFDVLLLLLLLSISCLLPQAQAQSCSVADEKVLKRRRVEGVRANILNQLGLTEPPAVNRTSVPREILETFNALAAASASLAQERTQSCESSTIYASPVTAFVGSIEGDASTHISKRSAHKGPGNVLAEYKITFNFDLSSELENVRRAELLLYQIPSPSAYKIRSQQYIEIKATYESLGTILTVTGKTVDPRTSDFQAFNIAPAVNTWIDQGVRGNVTIIISVQCLGSSKCAHEDLHLEPVSFKDFDDSVDAPRLIITSRSPLENGRSKRQAATANPLVTCTDNQVTCCLKPLNISFKDDLKWDFVSEPESFEANYCEGICPIIDKMTPKVYEFLSQLQGNPAASVEPCCAGSRFEELQLIVVKSNGLFEVETIQNVKVTSCKCA